MLLLQLAGVHAGLEGDRAWKMAIEMAVPQRKRKGYVKVRARARACEARAHISEAALSRLHGGVDLNLTHRFCAPCAGRGRGPTDRWCWGSGVRGDQGGGHRQAGRKPEGRRARGGAGGSGRRHGAGSRRVRRVTRWHTHSRSSKRALLPLLCSLSPSARRRSHLLQVPRKGYRACEDACTALAHRALPSRHFGSMPPRSHDAAHRNAAADVDALRYHAVIAAASRNAQDRCWCSLGHALGGRGCLNMRTGGSSGRECGM